MVPLYTPLGPMMLTEPPGLRVTQSCLAIGKFPIAMILMSMIQYVIRYSWIPGFKGKKTWAFWMSCNMLAICCNTYSNNECHLLGVQILAIVQRWTDGRTDGCTFGAREWKCCGQQEPFEATGHNGNENSKAFGATNKRAEQFSGSGTRSHGFLATPRSQRNINHLFETKCRGKSQGSLLTWHKSVESLPTNQNSLPHAAAIPRATAFIALPQCGKVDVPAFHHLTDLFFGSPTLEVPNFHRPWNQWL